MEKPEPEVHLLEFADSAWNMQLRAWIPDVKRFPRVRNELNQSTVRTFNKYGTISTALSVRTEFG